MWQTTASTTEISTHWDWIFPPSLCDGGRRVAWVGKGGSEVCSQTRCCANINHVDSHKIIRADHSQSVSLHNGSVLMTKSKNANFCKKCKPTQSHTDTFVLCKNINTENWGSWTKQKALDESFYFTCFIYNYACTLVWFVEGNAGVVLCVWQKFAYSIFYFCIFVHHRLRKCCPLYTESVSLYVRHSVCMWFGEVGACEYKKNAYYKYW